MAKLTFFIVDVFAAAAGKYTGNQLAVFTTGSSQLSDGEMQRIAKEMNYSETTFVLSSHLREGGYDVRIFTPEQELPFAGHPTLGTAYIIQREIVKEPIASINLNLKVGQIPLALKNQEGLGEIWWMQQKPPTFHKILSPREVAAALNLDEEAIDIRFPIQEVSTGIPFIIVPLKTRADLQRAKIDRDRYFQLIRDTEAKCILIFCPEPYQPDSNLGVRMFADALGIPEDPATGSANGCLAGYLVEHSYFGQEAIAVRVDQGYEIGRPSLLLLNAEKQGSQIAISVGGKVEMVARGEFL
ncbi:MAG: PhzF family phenazine biosynthesis protein [Oscillatoria sp. SIO1A7]|nr:PhzF family phenazine biosynthesis protein [Oscillatoria sp. SIO1A7]